VLWRDSVNRNLPLFLYLLGNPLNGYRLFREVVGFSKSGNVGRDLKKILIRFADLSIIFRRLLKDQIVCEFGSGSSTLFFVSHNKVALTTSFEQFEVYLPRLQYLDYKNWNSITGNVILEKELNLQVPRFTNYMENAKSSTLIYVDGPATPVDPRTGLAIANREIPELNDLRHKIVLIDCRLLTVIEVALRLRESHLFFPSQAVLTEYSKLQKSHIELNVTIDDIFQESTIYNSRLFKLLIRTSAFFPKKPLRSFG